MIPPASLFYLLPVLAGLASANPIHPRADGKPCPSKGDAQTGAAANINAQPNGDKPSWANYAASWGGQNRGSPNGDRGGWGGWRGQHQQEQQSQGQGQSQAQPLQQEQEVEVVYVDVTQTMTRQAPQPTPTQQRQVNPQPTQEQPAPSASPAPQPQPQPQPQPDPQPEPMPEPKPDPEPSPQPAPQPNPAPVNNDQQGWVDAHSQARAAYGQKPVVWSDGAYQQARANAEAGAARGCGLQHTDKGQFGENLFWSSDCSGNKNPTDVVGSWMSEVKDYNYDNPDANNFSKIGHFTAIVWKDVTAVGCAATACPGNTGTYVACCYDPFPNVSGQFKEKVPRPL